jgi:sporulation protein YabP
MANEEIRPGSPHNVIMQNRSKLSVSGVEDVENFDDREIVMYTSRGKLTVHGAGLHIARLSVEDGDLTVEGEVDTLQYSAENAPRGGLFSKLFG